ncbi:hypothetical protein B0H16DRAFT_1683260 [Mycena metata]|uniref:Uncharacterized protein n=1 Tax=Mycena metata TaxID=1033252 RepID=A0AAD7NX83_9AGAR|nr:hypothetical protein B0H16DRAFT_1683260 [Mycena metata]
MDLSRILCPIPPVLTFKNPCGRAGCDHAFEYAGSNPFQKLANLVATHAPHCKGHKNDTAVPCETEWQPPEKVFQAVLTHNNFAGLTTEVIHDREYDGPPHSTKWPSYDGSDTEDDVSIDSVSSRGARQRKARTSKPRSAVSVNFTAVSVNFTAVSVNFTAVLEAPPGKKKGARTEAQRRALLEGDVWTRQVNPHSVGCRGCKRTIKLDGRSRYYPGLWEKHRERCNGIKIGLIEMSRPCQSKEIEGVEEGTPIKSLVMASQNLAVSSGSLSLKLLERPRVTYLVFPPESYPWSFWRLASVEIDWMVQFDNEAIRRVVCTTIAEGRAPIDTARPKTLCAIAPPSGQRLMNFGLLEGSPAIARR